MPIGGYTWMGPKNHVLDGDPDPSRSNFWVCPAHWKASRVSAAVYVAKRDHPILNNGTTCDAKIHWPFVNITTTDYFSGSGRTIGPTIVCLCVCLCARTITTELNNLWRAGSSWVKFKCHGVTVKVQGHRMKMLLKW